MRYTSFRTTLVQAIINDDGISLRPGAIEELQQATPDLDLIGLLDTLEEASLFNGLIQEMWSDHIDWSDLIGLSTIGEFFERVCELIGEEAIYDLEEVPQAVVN